MTTNRIAIIFPIGVESSRLMADDHVWEWESDHFEAEAAHAAEHSRCCLVDCDSCGTYVNACGRSSEDNLEFILTQPFREVDAHGGVTTWEGLDDPFTTEADLNVTLCEACIVALLK